MPRAELLTPAPPALRDAWPPALRLLLGEPALDLWDGVLAGGRLVRLRPRRASMRPGGGVAVRYTAEVAWDDGRRTRESVAATTGPRPPAGTRLVEVADGSAPVPVAVWRWPDDPALPGLAWATRARPAADRLAALGPSVGPLRLRLRSYRTGRRAVVEGTSATGTVFLKVVRPAAVGRLVERHAVLDGAVPVPPVLASTEDGVVVTPAMAGTSMRDLLAGDGAGLPEPDTLDAMLDALPRTVGDVAPPGRVRPGNAIGRVEDHVAVLGTLLPELRPRLGRLRRQLTAADPGDHPDVAVHGDFYESQVLVDGGAVTGLLDVDTVGRGHRIDDWATLLGHLVLQETVLPRPATAAGYRARLQEAALGRWPADQLHPRVAAVLLGLAAGPFRVLQRDWPERVEARVALAEHWAAPRTR